MSKAGAEARIGAATTGLLSPRRLFTLTVFLASFLLFLIQPMFARMILPRLGGAPSVWNTAMLFYQAMLLAGYLYADRLARLPLSRQRIVHLALFAAAALTLPIGASLAYPALGDVPPALWLIGLLLVSIGPVFFVVAAQAPLMQAWFSRTGDPSAADPYFLYAASNFGSLLALVSYPFVVEPTLTLARQSWLWSGLFVLLAVLLAACGAMPTNQQAVPRIARPVGWRLRLRWMLLAAVPSGLLLSTTTHLTTDIMAMPLLWVIPLAVYLLTYILAFSVSAQGFVGHAARYAAPALLILGGYSFMASGIVAFLLAAAGVLLLFYVALALHGELARLRPPPEQLTDFYLWMSIGGALGGLFCGLLAPLIFDWTYEHPLLFVAAAALLPARPLSARIGALWSRRRFRPVLRYVLPPLSLLASLWVGGEFADARVSPALGAVAIVTIALAAVLAIGRGLTFAFHFAMLMLALGGWRTVDISTIAGARERSFFGVYTVEGSHSRQIRKLMHGTTLHGIQSTVSALETQPMSYYSPGSGVGRLFASAGPTARMGFVGLGTGTLACYARPGQRWTAYEIDPAIVRLARDSGMFTYIRRCKPDMRIVLGDARLSLAEEPKASLDMLAVDAFSSDAIPLHLMTTEAIQVYAHALAPDGVLLVHISNRFIDLEPVVAAIAEAQGWSARLLDHRPSDEPPGAYYTRSLWIALTRSEARMNEVLAAAGGAKDWKMLQERPGLQAWTDDHASALRALK